MPELSSRYCADSIPVTAVQAACGCAVHPNTITLFNLIIVTPIIMILLMGPNWQVLLAISLIRGVFDIADGTLARKCGLTSKLGAVLDIGSDTIFIWAILATVVYARRGEVGPGFIGLAALVGTTSAWQFFQEIGDTAPRPMTLVETLVADNSIVTTPLLTMAAWLYIHTDSLW